MIIYFRNDEMTRNDHICCFPLVPFQCKGRKRQRIRRGVSISRTVEVDGVFRLLQKFGEALIWGLDPSGNFQPAFRWGVFKSATTCSKHQNKQIPKENNLIGTNFSNFLVCRRLIYNPKWDGMGGSKNDLRPGGNEFSCVGRTENWENWRVLNPWCSLLADSIFITYLGLGGWKPFCLFAFFGNLHLAKLGEDESLHLFSGFYSFSPPGRNFRAPGADFVMQSSRKLQRFQVQICSKKRGSKIQIFFQSLKWPLLMPFQTSPFFGKKNTALGEDTVDGIDGKLLEPRGRRVNTMLNEVILSVMTVTPWWRARLCLRACQWLYWGQCVPGTGYFGFQRLFFLERFCRADLNGKYVSISHIQSAVWLKVTWSVSE